MTQRDHHAQDLAATAQQDAQEASARSSTANASAGVEASGVAKMASKGTKMGKGSLKRKLRSVARYSAIAAAVGAIVIVGGAVLCAPDMSKYELRSEVLYDRAGNIIYASLSEGDYLRIKTEASKVDPLYLRMLLSSEDERFYLHPGVDPIAAGRALISNLTAGATVSGASTLAMQVCRMLEPKERNLLSKLKEAFGALYITAVYGRDQVLDMYLTLAPFGGNIESVTAASYSYFNHGPSHLTPAEAALLVAMPRSPEVMRPDRKPKAAAYYRNEVLKKAVTDGLIQSDILNTATTEHIPGVRFPLEQNTYYLGQSIFKGTLRTADLFTPTTSAASHASADTSAASSASTNADASSAGTASATADASAVSSATESKVMDMELPHEIVTSIDPEVQRVLLDAVAEYAKVYVKDDGEDNIAVLAVDNQTFEVKGYVGAVGAKHTYVDAVQALRSPGSTLKPFVYGMAFEKGLLHPNTILLDSARMYRTYQPRNYDRKFFGEMSAATALQASLNLPALDIMTAIGPVNFIRRLNSIPNTLPYNRDTIYPPLDPSAIATSKPLADVQYTDPAAQQARNMNSAAKQGSDEITAARVKLSYPAGRIVLPKNGRPDISMALGGAGISLFDLTQLYAALANDGVIQPLRLTPVAASEYQGEPVDAHNSDPVICNHADKLLDQDAARAVFKILEGSTVPLGFYREDLTISYKTGTSFKSRDVWAIGSLGNMTVGVWIGRNDGSPTNGYTGYSNAAPVLFSIFNEIKIHPRKDLKTLNSVLLQPTPPVALSRIEIKAIGRVQKRSQAKLNETKTLASLHPVTASTATSSTAAISSAATSSASAQSKLMVEPIQLVFPLDNSRINAGFSKRIMIQFKGGTSPYYVLINDQVHDRIDYFEPKHNGVYTVTVIDSNGKSASSQVFIQGIDQKATKDKE